MELAFLGVMGIPTAITGFCFWLLQRKITKADKAREKTEAERDKWADERDAQREQLDLMLLKSTSAAIALGEATSKAVQRIPDAHCNGDMRAALEYAANVKHQQKDFLTSVGVHAMHEDI